MIYPIGKSRYNSDSRRFTAPDGKEKKLTPTQGRLFKCLIENKNKTVPKATLLGILGREENCKKGNHTLYVFIGRLKKVIKADGHLEIDTSYGKGYGLKEHEWGK
ncbi:transcriptional regulator [Chitinophaga sp. 30R24]|uniref:winged helix-turn-helix domain-containing protein n=1 Tax=Chitinophaga sp. 30R24 TaxID=3248838 RepID=UPI003B8FCEBE